MHNKNYIYPQMAIFQKLFLLAFFLGAAFLFAADIDTSTIPYKWISPKPFSIITTNSIRLCVDSKNLPNGGDIKKVIFHLSYQDHRGRYIELRNIDSADSYPYEVIWNCSQIPDHVMGKLRLEGMVINHFNQRIILPPLTIGLDRNPGYKTILVSSQYRREKPEIDGLLLEWKNIDSLSFKNNDDQIVFHSFYDQENLYCAISVFDQSILSHFDDKKRNLDDTVNGKAINADTEDDIELFFDPMHNHHDIRDTTHKQFLFTPAGLMYLGIMDSGKVITENLHPPIQCKMRVLGTINDESDRDTGWIIECAIPWKLLGLKTGDDRTLGFEIWNNDRDFFKGEYFYSSWSGIEASNLQNPSEWGNLQLTGHIDASKYFFFAFFILTALALAAFVTRYYLKSQKAKAEEAVAEPAAFYPEKEEIIFQKSIQYIQENYKRDLSLEEVVKAAATNHTTITEIFKAKTGLTFSSYLTQFRIEKAKYLLKNTKLSVSEIAFEVGFNSYDYFGAAFKKQTKLTPQEYRNQAE